MYLLPPFSQQGYLLSLWAVSAVQIKTAILAATKNVQVKLAMLRGHDFWTRKVKMEDIKEIKTASFVWATYLIL